MIKKTNKFQKWALIELVAVLLITLILAVITYSGIKSGSIIEVGFATSKMLNLGVPLVATLGFYEISWIGCFFLGMYLDKSTHSIMFTPLLMSGILGIRIIDLINDLNVSYGLFSGMRF
jgi:hypothetical protein